MNNKSPEFREFALIISSVLIAAAFSYYRSQPSPWQKARPGIIAEWERALTPNPLETPPHRSIADNQTRGCLKERVTIARLRAEISRLETSHGATPVRGSWNGHQLSKFPPSQAALLNVERGKWIHPTPSADCGDVPCILNRIYGSQTGEEGLKVYWWYLRMGYQLACAEGVNEG